MSSQPTPTVSTRVAQLMAEHRVTQAQVGKILGIDQPAVSKRLNGHIRWRVDELYALAPALGVPVRDLLPEGEVKP